MTFRQFVVKNVTRNKRLYAAYFLSSMFTVMVFFIFAMFDFHLALGEREVSENALLGMGVAGGIIYILCTFFPMWAVAITLISFIFLFLVISFLVILILRLQKLTELMKVDKQPKTEPKASIALTLLAFILLATGYSVAVLVRGIMVITVMIPVIIAVTIGTYFLFTQFSVFTIRFLKKRKRLF